MAFLIVGLIIFFSVHAIRMAAPGFRDARLASMGEASWKGIYSIVALVGFVLIVFGWMAYRPFSPIMFDPPAWGVHAANALVLVAFVLLAATYLPRGYIKTLVGHPFLTAVALWALGHLLANGDMASLLLFGSFFVYAIANRVAVMFRGPVPAAPPSLQNDGLALLIGVAGYAIVLFWLHLLLFGVSPRP